MKSIVLLMIFTFIVIPPTVLTAAISALNIINRVRTQLTHLLPVFNNKDYTEEACPLLMNDEYFVTMKSSNSELLSGCSYIFYNSSDTKPQKYSLFFEDRHYNGPLCRERGVEYMHFYCLSKPQSKEAKEGIKRGHMFINIEPQYNNIEDLRCALFEEFGVFKTELRVIIAKGPSCDGLEKVINNPDDTPWDSNASLLLTISNSLSLRTQHTLQTPNDEDHSHGAVIDFSLVQTFINLFKS